MEGFCWVLSGLAWCCLGQPRGTRALARPPAAPRPASLQRSRHLSQGNLASGSQLEPRAPRASLRGASLLPWDSRAAVTPHSLSSMVGVSSSVPCSCGEGLRPQPSVDREGRALSLLGRDHETVQGPTRPPTPKAGLCTEGVTCTRLRHLEAAYLTPRGHGRPVGQ